MPYHEFSLKDAASNMDREIIEELLFIENSNHLSLEATDDEMEEEDSIEIPGNDVLQNSIASVDKEEELTPPDDPYIDQMSHAVIEKECNLNQKYRDLLKYWREKEINDLFEINIASQGYEKALETFVEYYMFKNDSKSNQETIKKLFDE